MILKREKQKKKTTLGDGREEKENVNSMFDQQQERLTLGVCIQSINPPMQWHAKYIKLRGNSTFPHKKTTTLLPPPPPHASSRLLQPFSKPFSSPWQPRAVKSESRTDSPRSVISFLFTTEYFGMRIKQQTWKEQQQEAPDRSGESPHEIPSALFHVQARKQKCKLPGRRKERKWGRISDKKKIKHKKRASTLRQANFLSASPRREWKCPSCPSLHIVTVSAPWTKPTAKERETGGGKGLRKKGWQATDEARCHSFLWLGAWNSVSKSILIGSSIEIPIWIVSEDSTKPFPPSAETSMLWMGPSRKKEINWSLPGLSSPRDL